MTPYDLDCPKCQGTGRLTVDFLSGTVLEKCPDCDGTGKYKIPLDKLSDIR